MLRNVLTIVWCRFGSWSLFIISNFWSDFEHKVWSGFYSWSTGKISNHLKLEFGQYLVLLGLTFGSDLGPIKKLPYALSHNTWWPYHIWKWSLHIASFVTVRDGFLRKRMHSFRHCPNYLLLPIRELCTTFFRRPNSRFESKGSHRVRKVQFFLTLFKRGGVKPMFKNYVVIFFIIQRAIW